MRFWERETREKGFDHEVSPVPLAQELESIVAPSQRRPSGRERTHSTIGISEIAKQVRKQRKKRRVD